MTNNIGLYRVKRKFQIPLRIDILNKQVINSRRNIMEKKIIVNYNK